MTRSSTPTSQSLASSPELSGLQPFPSSVASAVVLYSVLSSVSMQKLLVNIFKFYVSTFDAQIQYGKCYVASHPLQSFC